MILLLLVLLCLPLSAADRLYVGLTQSGARIVASAVDGPSAAAPVVLLIGGLHGEDDSSRIVTDEIKKFEAIRKDRRPFRLLAIPLANPDGSSLSFPPAGVAYRENPESHYLWRWTALQAPDLVLITGGQYSNLSSALSQNVVAGIGRIPAGVVAAKPGILKTLPKDIPRSEARVEMERRRSLAPREFAGPLSKIYGQDFDQPTYIPGMALISRMRLGQLEDVQKLAEPYAGGAKDPLGTRPSSLNLAGHLVFAELAERTSDSRYLELVRKAANLGFTENGEMKESMPFHDEMSDSVFMGTAIVARAGRLTGESKYFDMAVRHQAFMEKLDLRADGLYRHSPLTDAAWGRGNAFPALGLALTLSDLPKDHPGFARVLMAYQKLMLALANYQDPGGMWHEVIDEPASYAETSATSMIAFAMLRGIRNGWLDEAAYRPRVERAWRGMLSRVGSDGKMLDVCESTNKQKSLKDYLQRAASSDVDPRGGAMALLFATEMAGLK